MGGAKVQFGNAGQAGLAITTRVRLGFDAKTLLVEINLHNDAGTVDPNPTAL